MKKPIQWVTVFLAAFFFAALLAFLATRSGSAATTEDGCNTGGGAWTPDAGSHDFGSCTYPANSAEAISNCGADNQYVIIYFSSEGTQDFCTPAAPATASNSASDPPVPSGCHSEVRGPLEEPVTLAVCHGKNGAATFPRGACPLKCTITSTLPASAARKLPKNTVATVYVRTIAPGGESSHDSYTVCFRTQDLGLDPPVIFRFVGGAWTPVAIGNANSSLVCASGSSEGSYALGQPPKKN